MKMSKSLKSLHALLVKQVFALSKRLDAETDPAMALTIVREQEEFTHRMNLVAALLFTKESEGIQQMVAGVNRANRDLSKAIREAKQAAELVASATAVLSIADEVIDLAKVLA